MWHKFYFSSCTLLFPSSVDISWILDTSPENTATQYSSSMEMNIKGKNNSVGRSH